VGAPACDGGDRRRLVCGGVTGNGGCAGGRQSLVTVGGEAVLGCDGWLNRGGGDRWWWTRKRSGQSGPSPTSATSAALLRLPPPTSPGAISSRHFVFRAVYSSHLSDGSRFAPSIGWLEVHPFNSTDWYEVRPQRRQLWRHHVDRHRRPHPVRSGEGGGKKKGLMLLLAAPLPGEEVTTR